MGKIRAARNECKLTIKEASEYSGIAEKTWKRIERELIVPNADQVRSIARVLKISPTEIIGKRQSNKDKHIGEGYVTHEDNPLFLLEPSADFSDKGKLKVVDLFCGVGGLSHGFEKHPDFQVCLGLDLLEDRVKTFHANHPNAYAICGDVRNFGLNKILEHVGKVDVLLGGPPCQGFSSIRPFRNLTESDGRNSLPEYYLLAISKLKPEWVIFENVVGILSTKSGNVFEQVLSGIEDLGYHVDYKVINAVELGIPQNRERVFIVGRRTAKDIIWMTPKHFVQGRSMAGKVYPTLARMPLFDNTQVPLNVHDAISDLPAVNSGETRIEYSCPPKTTYQEMMREDSDRLTLHTATKHSDKMMEIIKLSGKNRGALPENLTTSGFSSCYSRLDYDEPSTTLTVNFVHPSSNRCIHPTQNRALTPREGARLQGFKDNFKFLGTRSNIVRQIGNAVPPLISKEFAEMIISNY